MLQIYTLTSVFVVVGREEGPFSAPKALEAPMGELGPDPGALLVGAESMGDQGSEKFASSLSAMFSHLSNYFKLILLIIKLYKKKKRETHLCI